MRIKISVQQLKLGMYIHEFCGSWLDHPFLRGSFLLHESKDLQAILASGITHLWIDDEKGIGLETAKPVQPAAVSGNAIQPPPKPIDLRRVDLKHEAARAAVICAKSRQAVTSMFNEVRMGKALNGAEALPIVEEISESVLRNSHALIGLARLKTKDDYTYMHSIAVCALMISLARQLELDEARTRQAGMAGLLHDIGKMATPIEIINKPGKLTDDEFAIIRSHPRDGEKILRDSTGVDHEVILACLHHHEKVDGSGYPARQKGDEISLLARMCAVCDVYDAITSTRAYKNGWEPSSSIRRMAQSRGTHFDQRIFDAFVRSLGIYPVGTLVRLESERLGIIVEQTEKLLTPVVKVFFSVKSNTRVPIDILDLSHPSCRDKIVSHEDPQHWQFQDLHTLWSGVAN